MKTWENLSIQEKIKILEVRLEEAVSVEAKQSLKTHIAELKAQNKK